MKVRGAWVIGRCESCLSMQRVSISAFLYLFQRLLQVLWGPGYHARSFKWAQADGQVIRGWPRGQRRRIFILCKLSNLPHSIHQGDPPSQTWDTKLRERRCLNISVFPACVRCNSPPLCLEGRARTKVPNMRGSFSELKYRVGSGTTGGLRSNPLLIWLEHRAIVVQQQFV